LETVLVTGSKGFIGRNLLEALSKEEGIVVKGFDIDDAIEVLGSFIKEADFVFHLAGVNRPKKVEEFSNVNAGLTRTIISLVDPQKKKPPIVLSSSTQALLDNPYGASKKEAENLLCNYSAATGAPVYIYRLTNVFGKWSRPNYNSVVATFCHNVSHGLDITISDEKKEIELVYVDDVVKSFLRDLKQDCSNGVPAYLSVTPTFKVTLGDLAKRIYQLRDIRYSLVIPDLSDGFMKRLYTTYLSYLDTKDLSYPLELKKDHRGSLVELLKSHQAGQIFISTSHKAVVRGNHYHTSKVEKFCLVKGRAIIRLRHIFGSEVLSYRVSDEKIEVVDIPPGYAHSIENVSDEEMIVLFWAGEIFDPSHPDTYPFVV
jgi:UDP-2-acetamido-2,6-beta-L-arabino-hexul-4-ose reductase